VGVNILTYKDMSHVRTLQEDGRGGRKGRKGEREQKTTPK
jgi:hypothetical protein